MSAPDRERAWSAEPWGTGPTRGASTHYFGTFSGEAFLPLEDYARACACVNALAGIPDPEEALRLAREALQAAAWHANTAEFHDRYRAALEALGGAS